MANVYIPYGRGSLAVDLPEGRVCNLLTTKVDSYAPSGSENELIERALENPFGSPRLCQIAAHKKRVVIITSDHTRPVPSRLISPHLLKEIREENPDADITFLVATGFHRPSTREELIRKFGEEILSSEKILIHDAFDEGMMADLGRLPSGGILKINKIAAEADLLIAEGLIEAHVFAGFSGGRKSVLPGIAGGKTVMANHCAEFIAHPNAKAGILDGNPIHEDMLYAAKKAGLAYILNVALDSNKKVIAAFAGDMEEAHTEGCKFVESLVSAKATASDIVITSNGGYPLDQNVYQHVKALSTAGMACKDGGVIIACAELSDGHGSGDMLAWLGRGCASAMDAIIGTGRNDTVPDQWATQIMASVLLKHRVIFVTQERHFAMLKSMQFGVARSVEEAMAQAEKAVGEDATVTIIPDGAAIIVKRR